MLLVLLLGLLPALARPLPLLGPTGPSWIGPLEPGAADPRGLVLVDPAGGGLYLSLPGAAGDFVWEGGAWTRGGEPLTGADPSAQVDDNPVPAHLRMTLEDGQWVRQSEIAARVDQTGRGIVASGPRWGWRDGALVELIDRRGGLVRLRGDAQGRPLRVDWPDGSVLVIEWDDFNRVARLDGPSGGESLRLQWQDGDLTVRSPDGSPMVVQVRPGEATGERQVRVSDASGRQAVAWYRGEGEGRRLIGWEDPRGLRTRVRWDGERVEVSDASGRPWWVERDAQGRVRRASDPSGGIWTWRRDAAGRVSGIEDPGGRTHAWARDSEGRLAGVGRGSTPWSLRRDAAGRVEEVVDPVGAVLRLQRDAQGRVQRILDPLGNEVRLDRGTSGSIESVRTRTGQQLRLERDVLGRITRLGGPGEGRLELRRDASGRLVGLRDGDGLSLDLDRGGKGEVSRLRLADGQSVALVRDGLARLAALRWADGSELRLRRDVMGEVVQADLGTESLTLQRDLNGAVVQLGAVRFVRDGGGRVRQIQWAGRTVDLGRDAAGLIRSVRAGTIELSLLRDAAGRVVSWSGSDGEVLARRNLSGRITSEEVRLPARSAAGMTVPVAALPEVAPQPPGPVIAVAPVVPLASRSTMGLSWDLSGRIQRVDEGSQSWRFMRDAAGRLLRVQGPSGLSLGQDRDALGRIVLVRLPFQSMMRLSWAGMAVEATLLDATSRVVATRSIELDGHGRVRRDLDALWGERTWRRDGPGRVVAIDVGGQPAWAIGSSRATGPDGWSVERDTRGRPTSARAVPGALPWGMSSVELGYRWSESGPLVAVGDGMSLAVVDHDPLGRLSRVQVDPGSRWELRYDARGRLAVIERDGLEVERLRFGPAVDGGPASLLASGPQASTAWVPGSLGPGGAVAGATGQRWDEILDTRGLPWWQLLVGGGVVLRSMDLRGYPELAAAEGQDLVGVGGGIQLFSGGPVLLPTEALGGAVPAGVAIDPVSGARLDGLRSWPWVDEAMRASGSTAAMDPEAWQAGAGPWGNPLRLLVAMGQIEDPEGGDWLELPTEGSALAWLPASLDGMSPPLGPSLDALPLAEDPLTDAWILACLPGGREPDSEELARLMLAAELDLPWLPPGTRLPVPGWRGAALAMSDRKD